MLEHELDDLFTDAVSIVIIAISRFTFTSIGASCIDAVSVHLTAIICSTSMYTLIYICYYKHTVSSQTGRAFKHCLLSNTFSYQPHLIIIHSQLLNMRRS